MYPMTVTKVHATHRGGTKEYTLIRVTNRSGFSLLITRWSKVRQSGQMAVEQFTSESDVIRANDEKWRQKFLGEYTRDQTTRQE
jgi:predicted DNA-binding WGR domain protein